MIVRPRIHSDDPLVEADRARLELSATLDSDRRAALGQFFTPMATARLMASMTTPRSGLVRLLDPGAGVGALTAAWVNEVCHHSPRPSAIHLTAFELDVALLPRLRDTLGRCQATCSAAGIDCAVDLRNEDFIETGVAALESSLYPRESMRFDVAILNPPYRKFRVDSRPRTMLRRLEIETSNLYTAFLALTVSLLADGGEFTAITPRSFCNGPYFRLFREHLLTMARLRRLHVFERRDHAFRDDGVLQENVIMHAVRGGPPHPTVCISHSATPESSDVMQRSVPLARVVRPSDPQRFIHLVPDLEGQVLADSMDALPCDIADLGLTISTGRVVDFRAQPWLRAAPDADSVPLLYPGHIDHGHITWPKVGSKKPNAIARSSAAAGLLIPAGIYVVVKRFSAKEERRRIVAALVDPQDVPGDLFGFENHLNYYHAQGSPLDPMLARGLVAFLNSSRIDVLFRQFNGHTQVNATDLRSIRYPSRMMLENLGGTLPLPLPGQDVLDELVAATLDVRSESP